MLTDVVNILRSPHPALVCTRKQVNRQECPRLTLDNVNASI